MIDTLEQSLKEPTDLNLNGEEHTIEKQKSGDLRT